MEETGAKRTKDLDYYAGYFDGEGCIGFYTNLQVGVSNTFTPALKELQNLFGGSIRTKTYSGRPCYEWRVFGSTALAFLNEISPFLKEKRPQAELAIICYQSPKEERLILKQALKDLKRIER